MYSFQERGIIIPADIETSLRGRRVVSYPQNLPLIAGSLGREVDFFGREGGYIVRIDGIGTHFFSERDYQFVGMGGETSHLEAGKIERAGLGKKDIILIPEGRFLPVKINIETGNPTQWPF